MNKKVRVSDLGKKDYKETWDYQTSLLDEIVSLKREKRNGEEGIETPNHFLLNEEKLKEKEATFYKINRGGDITYHGPGQIVGYPILDLENFFTDIHKYLRLLEESIILTIAEYGIKAERSEGETGVWLDVGTPFARKICAMGIRASRWVTMHGFALNVNANLGYFDNIIPCGIRGKAVTSMEAELGRKIPEEEVKEKILKHFKTLFEVEEFIKA